MFDNINLGPVLLIVAIASIVSTLRCLYSGRLLHILGAVGSILIGFGIILIDWMNSEILGILVGATGVIVNILYMVKGRSDRVRNDLAIGIGSSLQATILGAVILSLGSILAFAVNKISLGAALVTCAIVSWGILLKSLCSKSPEKSKGSEKSKKL